MTIWFAFGCELTERMLSAIAPLACRAPRGKRIRFARGVKVVLRQKFTRATVARKPVHFPPTRRPSDFSPFRFAQKRKGAQVLRLPPGVNEERTIREKARVRPKESSSTKSKTGEHTPPASSLSQVLLALWTKRQASVSKQPSTVYEQ